MADNAWKYRDSYARAADESFYEHGEEAGWPGIVPWEVLEAIASRESDGTPSARNPTPMPWGEHATGLLQIVPGGGIAWQYESVTGEPVDEQSLYDPDYASKVGAIGLAQRAMQIQYDGEIISDGAGIVSGVQDWPSVARIGWYGAGALGEATVGGEERWYETPTVGGAGDGDAWEADIRNYLQGFNQTDPGDPEGMSIISHLERGDWRRPADSNRQAWNLFSSRGEGVGDFVEGLYDLPEDLAKSAAGGIIGDLGGAIQSALPRVAMVAAGLVLFAGGLFAVKSMALGAVT